jgi:hypothetical protein
MSAKRLPTGYPSTCGPDCWLKQIHSVALPEKRDQEAEGEPATKSYIEECAKRLYQPIQPWQTRILNVKAGSFTDPLVCELVVADLIAQEGIGVGPWSKVVPYEALSYSWGYPAFTILVKCNDIDFPITRHLASALRHIRQPNKDRCIWTDAICVDQRIDRPEKSQQVSNMFRIFQKASKVIVWLGDVCADDSLALSVLKQVPISDVSTRTHDELCLKNCEDMSASVELLLDRWWFRRTWVRQEVFAARSLEVMCGPVRLPFSRLASGLRVVRSMTNVSSNGMGRHWKYLCFDILVESRAHSAPKRLASNQSQESSAVNKHRETSLWLETLLAGTLFNATYDQDRVYGIMGMVEFGVQYLQTRNQSPVQDQDGDDNNMASDAKLRVDYNRSGSLVFQDTVKYLINNSRDLTPLIIFQSRQPDRTAQPFWSLHLSKNLDRWYCRPTQLNFGQELHDFGPDPPQQDLDEAGILRLRGRSLGVVGEYSAPPQDISYFAEGLKSVIPWKRNSDIEETRPNLRGVFEDVAYKRSRAILSGKLGEANADNPPWRNQMATYVFVADAVEKGDELVLCDGSPYPFALRRYVEEQSPAAPEKYIFLGPAPLIAFDGLHYGKAVSRSELDRYTQKALHQIFVLV